MTRVIPPAVQAALDNQATEPLKLDVLFFADFESDPVFAWTGVGDIEVNGNTYIGLGAFGSISPIIEDSKLSDVRASATLTSIPVVNLPDFVTEVTEGEINGKDFTIDLVFLDDAGASIGTLPLTAGFMNGAEINEAPTNDGELLGGIKLGLATEATRLSARTFYRQTNQAQQALFAGDLGFEYVNDTDMREILWGTSAASVAPSGSGGSIGRGKPGSGRDLR